MATKLAIREQPALSRRKEFELSVDGIHYRLLRSSLTLGVVVLAVAFLANVLMESRIANACKRGVRAEVAQTRTLASLLAFTDVGQSADTLAERLAALAPGEWPLTAIGGWFGLEGAALARFQTACRDWRDHERWLDGLPPGQRRLLGGKRNVAEIMALLEDEAARQEFAAAARDIPLRLPSGFLEFAARRRALMAERQVVAERFAAARNRLVNACGEQALATLLATSTTEEVVRLFAAANLKVDAAGMATLRKQAVEREQARQLLEALRAPAVAGAWRERYRRVFDQNEVLGRLAGDPAAVDWFVAIEGAGNNSAAAAIAATASRILFARRLTETEERLTTQYGAGSGLSSVMLWLLVVSFVVCVVGITNAMLISVIERFREIATMKCLGALNSFIARLFLLEAAFLGVVGGLLGVIVGGVIGISRMFFAYGDWVASYFPWGGVLAVAGVATGCGLALAMLSALYPAYSAARMPPIEAMRVE